MPHQHLSRTALFVAALLLGGGPLACDDTASSYCVRDSDCPLGTHRCSDGLCTPRLPSDAGVDGRDGSAGDGWSWDRGAEASSDSRSDLRGDGGEACQGNGDDRIGRSEMPIAVGAQVAYRIGTGLTVDLQGTQQGGRTQWALLADAADDQRVVSELLPVFGWAQSDFKGATYVALIDRGQGAYGVFSASAGALQLLGVVSEQAAVPFLSGIDLAYAKPIDMLRFPVATGQYTSEASASGYFNGPWLYVNERYDVDVLGAGTLKLPDITFDVVLQRTVITQAPYANPFLTSKRTVFLFLAECYGIVARIVVDGEAPNLAAVAARERWRLTF